MIRRLISKLSRITSVALLLLLLSASGEALAQTQYGFSGDVCNVSNGDEMVDLQRTSSGVYNENTNNEDYLWAYCPFSGMESTTIDVTTSEVNYRDRDTNHSLKCQMWARTASGFGYVSSWRYSCSTAGGCSTDSNPSHTGYGKVSWTNPLNGGSSMSDVSLYTFKCLLYSKYSIEGTSNYIYILGYRTTQVNP